MMLTTNICHYLCLFRWLQCMVLQAFWIVRCTFSKAELTQEGTNTWEMKRHFSWKGKQKEVNARLSRLSTSMLHTQHETARRDIRIYISGYIIMYIYIYIIYILNHICTCIYLQIYIYIHTYSIYTRYLYPPPHLLPPEYRHALVQSACI